MAETDTAWRREDAGVYVRGDFRIEKEVQSFGGRQIRKYMTDWVISGPNIPVGDLAPAFDTLREAKAHVDEIGDLL